jgi:hypothetical protein
MGSLSQVSDHRKVSLHADVKRFDFISGNRCASHPKLATVLFTALTLKSTFAEETGCLIDESAVSSCFSSYVYYACLKSSKGSGANVCQAMLRVIRQS